MFAVAALTGFMPALSSARPSAAASFAVRSFICFL
jgi:hypothetical protein